MKYFDYFDLSYKFIELFDISIVFILFDNLIDPKLLSLIFLIKISIVSLIFLSNIIYNIPDRL